MDNKVTFRSFELRDVDFIYRAKTDKRVSENIVGDYSNFSYEDAIKWVQGCMKQNENFKYWAICTDDEFQNIVGWCGISEIDHKHRMAAFKSITVYHPNYRDSITWYKTWIFVLEYVFIHLNFNRLYSICLPTNKYHYQFLEYFPKAYEGVLRNFVYKDGNYYDVALFGISKQDYEYCKQQGLLDFDSIQNFLKDKLSIKKQRFYSLSDFIGIVTDLLDNPQTPITPETKFRDLDEWSSLLAVSLMVIVEGEEAIGFDLNMLNQCDTIKDLYEMSNKIRL